MSYSSLGRTNTEVEAFTKLFVMRLVFKFVCGMSAIV